MASINATLVLLPRQSLLFMPIALLLGHRDTLAVFCTLDEAAAEGLREGHVVDTTSPSARRTSIEGIERLKTETIQWGGRPFLLHSADDHTAQRLKRLVRRLDDPGPLHHLALVPSRDRVFFSMKAEPRDVANMLKRLYGAIRELLGSR